MTKLWFRILFATALALATAAAAHAQSLTPTGVSISPSSGLPGAQITIKINVANKDTTDFTGTASFSVLFSNLVSKSSFTLSTAGQILPDGQLVSKGVQDPTTGQTTPGAGTFTFTASIPTQTTEAGGYGTTVTLTAITGGTGVVGSKTPSSSTADLTVTGKPDLQITALSYVAGTSYVGGTVIPMSLTYVNNSLTNGSANVPYTPGTNGFPAIVRIQVVLSTNPTFGDADDFQLTINDISAGNFGSNQTVDNAPGGGNASLPADAVVTGGVVTSGTTHTFSWNQVLPGNFSGSYYVLAKIDTLNALAQNDPAALTVNGDNVWVGNALNPTGTLINLLPSNFPTNYLASHGTGVATTASGYSDNPSISSDGRYVAFASDATNLVTGDTNGVRDIFLFDSQTSLVRRLNLSQQGAQGNAASNNPAISANGRYVAFASDANNLVLGDTNGFSDIFVVDTLTGLIARVSGASAVGGQANNPSFKPAISQTGRYIVFESTATNLTANATAVGVSHVYLYDRDVSGLGTFDTAGYTATKLIDSDVTTPATVAGNANAIQATISADGTWVAFASKATNLVAPATTAGRQHVYVRLTANVGTATSGIKDVSVVTGTAAEGGADSQTPSLSSDGHYVAFASLATNLVVGDTNGVSDIFVYDNNQPVGAPIVRRMSVVTVTGAEGTDPSGAGFKLGSINPTISADGRYVAFASLDSNLTAGDIYGQSQPTDSNNALDIFVHDRDSTASGTLDTVAATTTMVSENPFGYQTNGILGVPSTAASNIYPVISANGRFVAFPSDAESSGGIAFGATNLLPLDTNGWRDVFLFDRRTNANITPATPPTVTITSPGATPVLVNTEVPLTASATTTIGVVSSVQFFVNGTSLGISTVFPYTQTWTPTAVGTFTLSALVTDNFGNIGVSPNVTVTVNAAPSVGITGISPGPANATVVSTAQTITATASVSNPGATITGVQFFASGVPLPAGVFAAGVWTTTWTPSTTGSFTLTAKATDSVGTQSTSAAVAVAVITAGGGGGGGGSTAPTVSLSPLPPSTAAVNSSVTLSANAAASTGLTITNVQFYANGILVGSVTVAPYTFVWVPLALGTYSITAVATDNLGGSTTSTVATVNVNGVLSIALSSPASGAIIPVNMPQTIMATASSSTGTVVSVQFSVNGVALATDTTYPFSAAWTPLTPGLFALTAKATDNLGNMADSAVVTVNVNGGSIPAIGIASPAAGSTVSVGFPQTVVVNASPANGTIASVELFANGVSIGSDTTFPYNIVWTPTGIGLVSLTAIATDTLGNQATSAAVGITVSAVSPGAPTVLLTAPTAGAALPVGVAALISATATDTDGTIASVEFLANGASLGTDAVFPYNISFIPGAPGTYVLTARATDNGGNVGTSAAISVTVTGGTAPNVSIASPVNGVTLGVNRPQTITASAASPGGFITAVQFFINGVSVSTDNAFPYAASWTPTAIGSYTLTARATDNLGNIADSAPITVVVSPSAAPTVAISNPADGSSYTAGTALTVAANASDSDGNVTQVQFYVNGALLGGADLVSPFSTAWTASSPGVYALTAQATDNSGNVTTSAPVTVTIGANAAPIVALTSPAAGSYSLGNQVLVSATANDSDGTVASVQFFANGLAIGTSTTAPYNTSWRPTVAGSFTITATATDNVGNVANSAPVSVTITSSGAPAVTISNPVAGAPYAVGNSIPFTATTNGGNGPIAQVQFFINGTSLSVDNSSPYSASWTPLASGTYSLLAIATDSAGISSSSSAALNITIIGNAPPAVTLTSPPAGTSVSGGTIVNLGAIATDVDGTVASVRFLANGNLVGTATAAPYSAAWMPSAAGSYAVTAQATDNSGNVTNSAPLTVTVFANQAPTVTLIAPGNGSTVRVNSATIMAATASDADGTIASVQFFANGVAIGSDTTAPYSTPWTPGAEGIYRISATALDNSGAATTSDVLTVQAVAPGAGGADSVYTGNYQQGITEQGRFAAINIRGQSGAFIGYSTSGASKIYFFGGLPIDGGGTFSATDAAGHNLISGRFDDISATGSLEAGRAVFIGMVAFPSNIVVAAGFYSGNFTGRADSTFVAIVGADGSITIYAADGTFRDAGAGSVAANGNFTVTTLAGNRFVGKADPATGFLTGTLTGGPGGAFMAAVSSGVSFSDGFLRNLSTRGQVGTGSNILIAGFTVSGDAPKQVLIRAIGPSLTAFGLTGALADPQLQLFNGNVLLSTNDNWGGSNELANASNLAGAFPLAAPSLDSIILATLPPGSYTAQVSGVGGLTGVALVELYDIDNLQPFSTQKVTNVATRGVVGTGQAQLIAGFVITGNTAKKVLIRAVGPTLGAAPFSVPGVLAEPFLRLVRSDGLVVRENDNWEIGNDAVLMRDASTKVGAFPLAVGSKDAAILINLPPGSYSAQVTGAGTTTGVALVEVYEVP